MNKESPLVPQGSFLEQKNQGRNRVKIAVFVVLAIHGAGLMALLMQGCQKAPDTAGTTTAVDTNTVPVAPTFVENTNYAPVTPDTNVPAVPSIASDTGMPPTTAQSTTTVAPPPLPLETPPQTQASPATAVTQHKVVAGDTLGKLAKQYKVSVKAIEAANPGVEPTRLRVDQVIQIPAPAPQTASIAVAPIASEPAASNGTQNYKVKSGDTLIRIAAQHGVSVKALRSANGLRTDRIRVNQVLKVPARSGHAASAGTGETGAMATTSAPPATGLGNP